MLNAYAIMGSCTQRTSLNFIKYTRTKLKKNYMNRMKYINNLLSYSFHTF